MSVNIDFEYTVLCINFKSWSWMNIINFIWNKDDLIF